MRCSGRASFGRARVQGLITIGCHQIREQTKNKQKQVDDHPYGGGMGMVMNADPLYNALGPMWWKASRLPPAHDPSLSPRARYSARPTQGGLHRATQNLILVCGHYEGVDERFIEECVDEELSIGDFVLNGGEIPAMAVTDAICRMIPGVLSDEECFTEESHYSGLLEYPQTPVPPSGTAKRFEKSALRPSRQYQKVATSRIRAVLWKSVAYAGRRRADPLEDC